MLLGRADEAFELDCNLLRCICRLMAQSGHAATKRQCLLSGVKRTLISPLTEAQRARPRLRRSPPQQEQPVSTPARGLLIAVEPPLARRTRVTAAWYHWGTTDRILARCHLMLSPRRRHRGPKPDRRRALELLATSPDGCTEALMFANGFTAELLIELVRAELASAHAERMVAGGRTVEVARMRITDAGRKALEATRQ
jgi:hypothetical protein